MKSFMLFHAAARKIFRMVGCRYNGIHVNQETSETTSAVADEIDVHFITDWSLDEMVQSVEMNGVTYSMPFTLNDLEDKYSLKCASVDFDKSGKVDRYIFVLYYCDMIYAMVDVFKPFDFNNIDNYKITSITLISGMDFKFGGISGIGSEYTKGDILKMFGEPSTISSDHNNKLLYMFDKRYDNLHHNVVVFAFEDDNETLKGITIRYNK